MKQDFLGDSYDLVKHFFARNLHSTGELYAHPDFVPPGMRGAYTKITSVKVYDATKPLIGGFGLLLDPDTGIPLDSAKHSKATTKHAPLPFIVETYNALRPTYIICFDQSHNRLVEDDKSAQMEAKRKYLEEHGIYSFYYNSHARFFFMADKPEVLKNMRDKLERVGIPTKRFVP